MRFIKFDNHQKQSWVFFLVLVLGLWLGGSLAVDCLVMPGLYATGMMSQPDFAIAGSTLFGWLNHAELLLGAVVLTGVLVLAQSVNLEHRGRAIAQAAVLLAIPLLYTYLITPEMTALGAQLELFGDRPEIPQTMTWLHGSYWVLELLKLGLAFTLFRQIDRLQQRTNTPTLT